MPDVSTSLTFLCMKALWLAEGKPSVDEVSFPSTPDDEAAASVARFTSDCLRQMSTPVTRSPAASLISRARTLSFTSALSFDIAVVF